jgi:hypothetical protein
VTNVRLFWIEIAFSFVWAIVSVATYDAIYPNSSPVKLFIAGAIGALIGSFCVEGYKAAIKQDEKEGKR